jgi:hypothetical protein
MHLHILDLDGSLQSQSSRAAMCRRWHWGRSFFFHGITRPHGFTIKFLMVRATVTIAVLIWRNLAEANLEESLARILSQIETDAVWFSIDKDVLPESEALTNWDQGQMPLAAIKKTIETIGAHKRVMGADICGEFSPARHSNWLKRREAKMDQPRRADDAALLARNESINRELLSTIERASR